jgi:hypothetical protein
MMLCELAIKPNVPIIGATYRSNLEKLNHNIHILSHSHPRPIPATMHAASHPRSIDG